jgi:transcriptional regulator GlxA family with amidase domain
MAASCCGAAHPYDLALCRKPQVTNTSDPFRVGVILTPGFSLMAYASVIELMRGANLVGGSLLYQWCNLSTAGSIMIAGSGLEVLTAALPQPTAAPFDMVVVVGGLGSENYRCEALAAFLRQMMRRDLIVGSLSTASFILARAGILAGRRCTVHWDYIDAFREAFPDIEITDELFVMHNRVFTCAGGAAAMDLMLRIIRERQGAAFASRVSETFIYGTIRQPNDGQRLPLSTRLAITEPVVLKTVELMEQHIETPLKLPELAARVGVSTRHLERLFAQCLITSPAQHYIRLRLERARNLLWHTRLPVSEVGLACGFASASHFSRAYRLRFRVVPRSDRRPHIAPLGFASVFEKTTGQGR